jgi:hypothetical protein
VIAAGIVIIVAHSIKKMKSGKKTSEVKTGSKKPDGKKRRTWKCRLRILKACQKVDRNCFAKLDMSGSWNSA